MASWSGIELGIRIAVAALANELPVYTCNPDDFAGIEGLEVVTVPAPERGQPDEPGPSGFS